MSTHHYISQQVTIDITSPKYVSVDPEWETMISMNADEFNEMSEDLEIFYEMILSDPSVKEKYDQAKVYRKMQK